MKPSTTVSAEQPSSPIRVCKGPDCTKKLQSNNKSGYCELHNYIGRRRPRPTCSRPGCTKKLQSNNTTGYCKQHWRQLKEAKLKKAPQLDGEDLEARRADDQWEEHHGETDTRACRICGKRMQVLGSKGKKNHLLDEHGLTVPEYHQYCQSRGWGTPKVSSLKTQKAITEWKDKHPEKVEGYRPVRLAKRKLLRRTDPNFVKHEGDLIRKRAQRKLTPADKEVRVQCQLPDPISGLPCGEWYRSLGAHLWGVHEISKAVYNVRCPGAPTEAPDLVGQGSKVAEFGKRVWAERKAEKEELKRQLEEAQRRLDQQQPQPEAPRRSPSIGNNGQSKRAREKSQLTRAVTMAYIRQPQAKGAWISQLVDEQGVPPTPTMVKNGLRSFENAWRNPRLKHNLEATYSKIHRGMEKSGVL